MAEQNRAVGYETIVAVQQERISALTNENVMLAAALREVDAELSAKNGTGDLPFVPEPRDGEPEPE